MRRPKKGMALSEVRPDLIAEWHPTLNGELTPSDVNSGSAIKRWWICKSNPNHVWDAAVRKRAQRGDGCPYCSNKRTSINSSLEALNPEVLPFWSYHRNKKAPSQYVPGSGVEVWWKCSMPDHPDWKKSITEQVDHNFCPTCQKEEKSLANNHPELLVEFDYDLNDCSPQDVAAGSAKKVWWKCLENPDHVYDMRVATKVSGLGCPYCSHHRVSEENNFSVLCPEAMSFWDFERNAGLSPKDFMRGSTKKVWWKCPEGDDHVWQDSICRMAKRKDHCPFCDHRRPSETNRLRSVFPELFEQVYLPKMSGIDLDKLTFKLEKKIWWKCPEGDDHIWKASIYHRTINGSGCPVCEGLKTVPSNSLSTLFPRIASEWHPSKNKNLTPDDVVPGSFKKVWWKCPEGDDHVWETSIAHRTGNGSNCPVCSNHKVTDSNSLLAVNPDVAKKWHPTKNGDLTPNDVVPGSSQKVWWKCLKGKDHEWQTTVYNVAKGSGCPYCTLTPQSRQELTICFELRKLFPSIDPKGFKTRVSGKLWTIDIYIPDLNLGIEFDGSYWHKDKRQLDKMKTKKLTDYGITMLRVREAPLKKITDFDIISSRPFDGKAIVNDIMRFIIGRFELSPRLLNDIDAYIKRKDLQNQAALDEYIDSVLTSRSS